MAKKTKPKVLATGSWYSERDCPASPKQYVFNGKLRGVHSFKTISAKPSGQPGERLVTAECKHCGGLIVDCPSINI